MISAWVEAARLTNQLWEKEQKSRETTHISKIRWSKIADDIKGCSIANNDLVEKISDIIIVC
jgi:hypothetical protein